MSNVHARGSESRVGIIWNQVRRGVTSGGPPPPPSVLLGPGLRGPGLALCHFKLAWLVRSATLKPRLLPRDARASALLGPGQVRSGQVYYSVTTRPKSRTMRAKRKKKTFESQQNEGAQMSNERESDGAIVMNLGSFGVDGVGYDETETEPPSSTNPQ